jgi:hypothetical protein
MSSVPVVRDVATHKERAAAHKQSGVTLLGVDDEWFSVCYFYAAYHLVKAALNEDPIFGSLTSLQKISPKLTPDVRFAEHHSGGQGQNGRSLGINEAVFHMYKNIRVSYSRLHIASCHVRYGRGLDTVSVESIESDFSDVWSAYHAGEIVAPAA